MRWMRGQKGVTLVELMITLVIFSIVISMIYSVFNAFLKQATSERKTAKTEMDVINVAWPLLKEIQSAGFGAPKYDCSSTTQCACHISVSSDVLTIHSTAAGNDQYAGKWGYVGTSCVLSTTDIPSGENVVVINNTDKSRLGTTTVGAGNTLTSCGSNEGNIAYWYKIGGTLECYETKYSLQDYTTDRPAMCAPDTATEKVKKLSRSYSPTTAASWDPMLDCVRDLAYRFGCISSSGSLTWQAGTDCGTSKLRLVKVGMIVQNSTRRDFQVPTPITLFEDLSGQSKSVTMSDEQRYYKWRKVEQTIILKNLE
jgi:prepilin-type N-terminal cleavage/methylation domain-containing protein